MTATRDAARSLFEGSRRVLGRTATGLKRGNLRDQIRGVLFMLKYWVLDRIQPTNSTKMTKRRISATGLDLNANSNLDFDPDF